MADETWYNPLTKKMEKKEWYIVPNTSTPAPTPAPAQDETWYNPLTKKMEKKEWYIVPNTSTPAPANKEDEIQNPPPPPVAKSTQPSNEPNMDNIAYAASLRNAQPITGKPSTGVEMVQTTTSGYNMDPAIKAQMDTADKKQAEIINKQYLLENDKAKFQQEAAQKIADITNKKVEEDIELQKKYNEDKAELVKLYNKASSDFVDAKVDPDSFWQNKGLGNKTANIIAFLALTAAEGFSNPGKPSQVIPIINNAVQAEINRQEEDINKLGRNVTQRTNDLARFQAEFKDNALARQALHDSLMNSIDTQLKNKLSTLNLRENTPQALERDRMLAQLDANKANRALQFDQAAANKVQTTTSLKPKIEGGITSEGISIAKTLNSQYESTVKPLKESIQFIKDVKNQIQLARQGEKAAMNAIGPMWAKHVQGAGVLSDSDLRNMGINRGAFEQLRDNMFKWTGTIPKDKLDEMDRITNYIENKNKNELNKKAAEYIITATKYNAPADLVVPDSEDLKKPTNNKSSVYK